ncbi:hypothetical protein MANI_002969 [Metarhizium anisopliae]
MAQGNESETYLNLGWTGPHITFGSGYDVAHRKLRSSAFSNFPHATIEPSHIGIKTQKHLITTAEELKSRIKADVKATIPLEGVSVETENSYLRNVQTSSTSLVQVITATVEDPPALVDTSNLKLSAAALSVLQSPDGINKFQERYGDYFVYGALSRARFNAVCTIRTSSASIRNQIKTKLEATLTEAGSLSAVFESLSKSSSEWASTDIDIAMSGVKGQPASTSKTNKIDEVQAAYDHFVKEYKTEPYIGMLCHYSVVDQRIPIPQKQFSFLGPALELLYQSLYMAQTQLLASPMTQAAGFALKISALCDEIKTIDVADKGGIAQIQARVNECTEEADRWRLRQDLIDDAKKLERKNFSPGGWIEAFNTKEWSSGILGVHGNAKYSALAGDVKYRREDFARDYALAASQKGTFTLGDSEDVILGFRVNSYWNDTSNGWFKMHNGTVGSSQVTVEFSSYGSRGCNWAIEVWTVSKLKYDKKE